MVVEGPLDPQGREDRPSRVVLVGDRRPEEGHETVAQELVDSSLVTVHLPEGEIEELVQEVVHAVGSKALGQGRGVGDVAEENGDLLALAFEGAARRQDLLDEVLGSVRLGGA